MLETAEDDRVIGIPHVMTTAGDKVYIINGRVMSGWSMYFSLTAIKSPENYTQIVDIVYNVSYILAAISKRANLSLGARFDIVDDPNSGTKDEYVKFIRSLVFDRLKINGRILKKISAHLDIYGNAYIHIRKDSEGIPDKLTILQPERLKIFLDPMTTKILFYIYLPPIIGGTVLVPYPYEKANPNLIQNIALTYPTPIIIPPEDLCHLKQQDWTEYPFGFSLLRACMEPAQARLDYTIISPMIYKNYSKPIIHWQFDPTSLNNQQVKNRLVAFKNQVTQMEPTSDLFTTNKWTSNVITGVSKGFSAAMDMVSDSDTQIFACLGVPETYFKPRGTTDRMVAEQDKTFIKEMKDRQEYFTEEALKAKIIYPALCTKYGFQPHDVPKVRIQWRKMIMTDDSIEIQNTIALLQSGIIDMEEARRRLSLPKTAQQAQQDLVKSFVKQSTGELSQQLPQQATPVPLAPGGAQPKPVTPPAQQPAAPGTTPYLFQEQDNAFTRLPNETDEDYFMRLESRSLSKPLPKRKPGAFEGADNLKIRLEGRVGEPADIELDGPGVTNEHESSRKCPYCAKYMFETQDAKGQKFRCQVHGYMEY